jgi:hypothetical protein
MGNRSCSREGAMAQIEDRIEAFSLVQRAILIQVSDEDGDLSDAESCLLKALDLDPHSIEALQEAAHFYDAVTPHAAKAMEYASRCREQAAKVLAEMDSILLPGSN